MKVKVNFLEEQEQKKTQKKSFPLQHQTWWLKLIEYIKQLNI